MAQNIMGRYQGMQKEKARQERVPKSMIVLLSATIQNQFCIKYGEANSFFESKPVASRPPATRTKTQKTFFRSFFYAVSMKFNIFPNINLNHVYLMKP